MKRLLLLLVVGGLLSCGEKTDEQIKNEILDYKAQITEIEAKIKDLENSISHDSTAGNNHQIVEVAELSLQPFEHFFQASGTVEAEQFAMVSPETGGQIKKIHITEGQTVSKGQLLISLNSQVLINSIEEVKLGLELATKIYEKQNDLWQQNIGSEIQYLEAKNAKESLERKLQTLESQLAMSSIKAPFSGIVDEIFVKEGEMAMPGMQTMQLVNLSALTVDVDVSETYLATINEGDAVTLTFPSYPDYELETKISRTGVVINKENRTFKIQLQISNEGNILKPNMIAVVRIKDYAEQTVLFVPTVVIKQDLNGYYLYVAENVDGVDVAKKKYIKTSISDETNTVVVSGVGAGERVITTGHHQVKDGMKISITN